MLSTVTSLALATVVSNVAHPQFQQSVHCKRLFQCAPKCKRQKTQIYFHVKWEKRTSGLQKPHVKETFAAYLPAVGVFKLPNLSFGNCQHILAWMIGRLIKGNWKWFWRRRFWSSRAGMTKTVISSFRHDVEEICALLGYYAAYSGNFLSTFRDNLSVPS
jgi:hypothetical protein